MCILRSTRADRQVDHGQYLLEKRLPDPTYVQDYRTFTALRMVSASCVVLSGASAARADRPRGFIKAVLLYVRVGGCVVSKAIKK